MTESVYKPPEADLLPQSPTGRHQFYVVSRLKLSALFIATLGLYLIYWFYVNWRNYRHTERERVLPLLRAIFYIFFTHSLFKKVDAVLARKEIEYQWSPMILATVLVVLGILGNVADSLSNMDSASPLTDFVSLIILPLELMLLWKVQGAINLSQGDPAGSSNSRFSIYNLLWILFGALLWVLITLGLLEIYGVFALDDY